jgi:hypothetical protein
MTRRDELADVLAGQPAAVGEVPSFCCPCCGMVSWEPRSKATGWCSRCQGYTACPDTGRRHTFTEWQAGEGVMRWRRCTFCSYGEQMIRPSQHGPDE